MDPVIECSENYTVALLRGVRANAFYWSQRRSGKLRVEFLNADCLCRHIPATDCRRSSSSSTQRTRVVG
jgi:hypothetical protein